MVSTGELFLHADGMDRLFCLLSGAEARYFGNIRNIWIFWSREKQIYLRMT